MRAGGLGLFHQCRNRPPGIAGFLGIDAVQTKHHRGIEHAAGIVSDLEARAGPGREVAVTGAIDKNIRNDRLTPGLGLDHQRVDALRIMHHHAGAQRMKENIDLVARQQIVGRDLIGRGVIGLRQDFPKDQMRHVEPAQTIDPRQQVRRDALHHPMHLAMNIGVQPAEIRHARRCPHAAEESITFDQQRAPPRARRSAAEHDDFILAIQRHLPRRFFDGFGGQVRVPG